MKKIIIVLVICIAFFSCSPKKEKIIAIDVLLVPSKEMYLQAIRLNTLMRQNNKECMPLDKNHIPHITLLQCFIEEKDLPKVTQALTGFFNGFEEDSLYAESIFYSKEEEKSFAMISIKKSEWLLKLHKKTIELVRPYFVKNGKEEAFVKNPDGSPISGSTLNYVPNFIEKYSYENFDPHISLGVAQKVFLNSLSQQVFEPTAFQAASLGVYQLGDHGTAQKELWSSN